MGGQNADPGGELRSSELLLIHGGELADVRALLRVQGAPFAEATEVPGAWPPREAAVVVATPAALAGRGLAGGAPPGTGRPRLIVVQDWGARGDLEPGDFDLVLRRPLEPSALAFVLGQALYRGPERRRDDRVPFGARVQFRAGLLRRDATLVELGLRGCRLVTRHGVRGGQRLTVYLPGDLAGGRELALRGRAIRFHTTEAHGPGEQALGVEFEGLPGVTWERLRNALLARSAELTRAPGVRGGELPSPAPAPEPGLASASAPAAAPSEPPACEPSRSETPGTDGSTVAETDLELGADRGGDQAGPATGRDQRRDPRRRYARRVIALGKGATRVLLARDLSPGGMRAAPTPHFAVGDRVRIALHVRPGEQPLVIRARVARDDGDHGLVLLFESPAPPAREYLRKMLGALPPAERAAIEKRDADLAESAAD